MGSMLLLYASTAASDVLQAALLSADHVQDLSEVESLFVALNVVNFRFCHHFI